MRAYFLTNMYLSPIQRGIQAQHCTAEMFVTYTPHTRHPAYELLYTWASTHKTTIVLNGGTSEELQEVYDFLMNNIEDYPFEKFYEPGIGNALTCVGVVLNQHMIDGMKYVRENPDRETCCVHADPTSPNIKYVSPQIQYSTATLDVIETFTLSDKVKPVYSKEEWDLCRMLAHKSLA